MSNREAPRPSKQARMLELRLRGLTWAQVRSLMLSEGYTRISEKTLQRYWYKIRDESPPKQVVSQTIIEELQRQQFLDISREETLEIKLRYRDKMLDKLMPRQTQPIDLMNPPTYIVSFDKSLRLDDDEEDSDDSSN